MAKRFVVCLDSSNADQNEMFKNYIDEQDLAWWHWLKNTWLLKDHKNKLNSEIIRDKVTEIYPNINNLVIELTGSSNDDTWSGFGPKGEKQNMFDWLSDTWSEK